MYIYTNNWVCIHINKDKANVQGSINKKEDSDCWPFTIGIATALCSKNDPIVCLWI